MKQAMKAVLLSPTTKRFVDKVEGVDSVDSQMAPL